MKRLVLIVLLAVVATGCYHATINSGRVGNGEMISQKWASGWLWGLVPPKTVEAAGKCPGGISSVETQLSFLNQLVSFVTIGIYTPMEIVVMCAGQTTGEVPNAMELTVAYGASESEIIETYTKAARLAHDRNEKVYVRFLEEELAEPGL